ncbi:hypothetical protein EHW99_1246 [Erwinia amylovora]|uniref:Uncharacterized protein n=3 Tax=Erwinia amylovora TaxID=552 RepID=A0A831A0T3_ERWAM|nr:hypothetical protein EaACW_2363 [Erwinia amylovora ACW56400]QJQ53952.1 hypothetical protein EHX00_1246 [Erwinia amylovora]CBA21542.1 hypothetical protein predicted by Glimmer/Critica [Erwinia amylovora CFBP1430]CBX81227.1 hypothetical protein predicted by Glimmer/Critica [Erwinia amylovora ATCC BAA-2158]CCO79207.1 hypothetical protein BN432_2420 [Erwinia amylovora Ea356]CCO83012.1 hypothetical protein BN433_2452 [Erwinia amylovora Ea266]CCO86779.1 hypothetical protein BN434_2401 [Erwinia a
MPLRGHFNGHATQRMAKTSISQQTRAFHRLNH